MKKRKQTVKTEDMARQKNDGRGRLGGRAKGTPNRVTGTVREWLSELIDRNRAQIEADLATLDPKTRLFMLEKLMQYVIPRQTATADEQREARAEASRSHDIDLRPLTREEIEFLLEEADREAGNDAG